MRWLMRMSMEGYRKGPSARERAGMRDNARTMSGPLHSLLPDTTDSDALLGRFLDYVGSRGLSLYPAQEEAVLEVFEDKNVILNTPTGSGKSLVASALHFASMAHKRRSV